MKKVLFFLWALCAVVVTSCSDDEKEKPLPQLNFAEPRYTLAKESIEVKLIADAPATTAVEVPFTLAGTAVEGTDYTVSDHAFKFSTGATEATNTVNRVEGSNEEKELLINLGKAPDGFTIGTLNYTSVQLMSDNSVFVTFERSEDVLTLQSRYAIQLEDAKGIRYKVPAETTFEVEVDPSSTAVEGTHFEFVDGVKAITVAKNDYKGYVTVKFLQLEEGKDKLVLKLKEKDGYAFGSNQSIAITIEGPGNFAGTWAFKEYPTALIDWWTNMWGVDTSTFPQGTTDDRITFTGGSDVYTFTPDLKGDLKNYFTSECQATFTGEVEKIYQEESSMKPVKHNVSVLKLDEVNVKFSATNVSKRAAVVGFRVITVDDEEILECTIDDFEPTDFLQDVYEMYKDLGYNPVMEQAPLRLYFTKVTENSEE